MRTVRRSSPTARPDADAGGPAPLSEEFVAHVAGAQRPLFAYIRSLVGPWADPEDILQEVNLVLCRKAGEFDHGPFLTWACRVAYLQVLAHLKRHRRGVAAAARVPPASRRLHKAASQRS